MDLEISDYKLKGLGQINVILGKNGCGKSTLLRTLDDQTRNSGYVRYITPERGGLLKFEGGIDTNIQDINWFGSVRRSNRNDNFRQISVSQFRRLETLVLRKIEQDPDTRANPTITFDSTIGVINELLDNVEIVRTENAGFQVRQKDNSQWREVELLSSGEAELISLAIEILSFTYASEQEAYRHTNNWLFFDEPDVHLHPDLQYRLMHLLSTAAAGKPFRVVISTHSTAILSALNDQGDVNVAFMERYQKQLNFEPVVPALKAVLPIFGSHPLSNVFNAKPILLVEGEDDERIWQQAGRSSKGKIRVWPCAAGDIQSLNEYEEKARSIIGAVYENAKAFSLRDRDDAPYEIEDLERVVRTRLNCRNAENLLLSDDVIHDLGTKWPTLQTAIEGWIKQSPQHPQLVVATQFRDGGWDRRNADIKALRNVLMALMGSQKPWEVAVGQSIAGLNRFGIRSGGDSLASFLGPKIVEALELQSKIRRVLAR